MTKWPYILPFILILHHESEKLHRYHVGSFLLTITLNSSVNDTNDSIVFTLTNIEFSYVQKLKLYFLILPLGAIWDRSDRFHRTFVVRLMFCRRRIFRLDLKPIKFRSGQNLTSTEKNLHQTKNLAFIHW